tara:strand:- start:4303 stop:5070 length:768 start_codon:yes stop_codon:yes gene_type:complete
MKIRKILLVILVLSITNFSCSSKKKIILLQNLDFQKEYEYEFKDYLVRADDILKINVSAESIESVQIFQSNLNLPSNNTIETMIFNGYQVDFNGMINFPVLGKVKVEGLNIFQIRDKIQKLIIQEGLMTQLYVDVKILNSNFTILGEVNNPGRYNYSNNNIDIFQAIGMAGDLTINGKRDDIKLIRNIGNKKRVISIDLTSTKFINDNNFQIFSGDLIIVSPNSSRVKNAGIIGNSGTLISLLSFLLSSIIVINN